MNSGSLLSLFVVTVAVSVSPATAQTFGGDELLYRFDGAAPSDYMGSSVAGVGDINGDGINDFVMSAVGADPGGISKAGSVYAYSGANGSLIWQWDGTQASQYLGEVAGGGDVDVDGFADVIIGTPHTDYGGITDAGSVSVYSGRNGSLLLQWHGAFASCGFGTAVANAGDINGDGHSDVIVGAPSGSNAVFVYSGATGSLLAQLNGTTAGDRFGGQVANAGDANGDGINDIVIGATGTTSPTGRTNAGSVYVYSGSTFSQLWRQDGYKADDLLGYSVGHAGDLNGDGFDDVIAGAAGANSMGMINNGTACALSGIDGSLIWDWHGGNEGDFFGHAVAGVGDFNNDGIDDVAVSAAQADSLGSIFDDNGAVYVYSGLDASLIWRWNGEEAYDNLGRNGSLDNVGDINGDGINEIIAGTYLTFGNGAGYDAGTAYVYSYSPFIYPEAVSFSNAAGASLGYQLDFPDSAAFLDYKVLISGSGTGPFNLGVDIPLTPDELAKSTFFGTYPAPSSGMHGTLDASGQAYAIANVPPGLFTNWVIGRTFHFAAIAMSPSSPPQFSSAAVPLTVEP